ncbi:MAG: exopolyphosphatase [Lactobacillaceae bacterium]|jgi:exopolyphosphatase/guanosine-5'-triphosphate,3'-diphosphate pyrophosphatase|nr:exopolyphosphatase [Lactobacillaceae bacterium]
MAQVAILDLGSNSVRMTINEYSDNGLFNVLERKQEMVRLSAGMGDDKKITPDSMEKAVNVLKDFKTVLNKYPKVVVKTVATAAVRQAKNQDEFLKRFKDIMGFELDVISGEQEAEYDYYGVIRTLPIKNAVIIDTGGASTELIQVSNKKMAQRISIPIGAVNLTEKFDINDKPSAKELFRAWQYVEEYLDNIPWLDDTRNLPIVAIGGSNRTLAKIARHINNQPDLDIHGYHMTKRQVNDIFAELLNRNSNERAEIRGLAKERADVIIGGLLPITNIIGRLDSSQVIFSQSGVREGVLFTTIEKVTKEKITVPEATQLTID